MRFGMIAAAAVALVCAGQAHAATYIVQGSIQSGGGFEGISQGSFKFIPSLGTLKSVTLNVSMDGFVGGPAYVYDANRQPATSTFNLKVLNGASIAFGNLGAFISVYNDTGPITVTGNVSDATFYLSGIAAPSTLTGDLDFFIGSPSSTASNTDRLYPTSFSRYTYNISATPVSGSAFISVYEASQNLKYSLTYDYDAAAVPELETWVMMILGVGVIGGAARRRKLAAERVTA